MAKTRDIKNLPTDLKGLIEKAVSESASEVAFTLQHVGPWWTGSFGENWKISTTQVEPTKGRTGQGLGTGGIPKREERVPKYKSFSPKPLGTSIFIGNAISYAGFVINRPGATMRDEAGRPVTYKGHLHGKMPHTSTAEVPFSAKYNWFNIYLKHPTFMQKDFDKGFTKSGFTVAATKSTQFYK
tara:strand:+ start:832 stop:1383 length:552 start_codon:yes stop_codon:yes gene_type:complete